MEEKSLYHRVTVLYQSQKEPKKYPFSKIVPLVLEEK
jgi:hypothetical protein